MEEKKKIIEVDLTEMSDEEFIGVLEKWRETNPKAFFNFLEKMLPIERQTKINNDENKK